MKHYLSKIMLVVLLAISIVSCNQQSEKSPFELKGEIEGIKEGKLVYSTLYSKNRILDTVAIKNGKFVIKGDFKKTATTLLSLGVIVEEGASYCRIFVENGKMTFKSSIKNIRKYTTTGSEIEDQKKIFDKNRKDILKGIRDLYKVIYNPKSSLEDIKKAEVKKVEFEKAMDKYTMDYIKKNPKSAYSLIQVYYKAQGCNGKEIKKLLSYLDKRFDSYDYVKELRAKIKQLKNVEVSVEKALENVENVNYKVDKSFKGASYSNIDYLASLSNKNICALNSKESKITIIDNKGTKIKDIKLNLKGAASTIAVDRNDNIYIMVIDQIEKVRKHRGKEYKYMQPNGVNCLVIDKQGNEKSKFKLTGLINANGAKVLDGKLLVSDDRSKKVVIFNKENGSKLSEIKDMRPCCGILDFGVNNKNQIIVANLGAFRVQSFDLNGKSILQFGKRGRGLNEFHGCCNPVSVAGLKNGAIVTVEKDPTRIKIYSKEGAKQIAGIDELVKGCSYIPMTVDSKDNLYLASAKKGIIKCIIN